MGGNDGLLWSNTWGLAEAGWTGLYLEPIGELVKQCRLIHAHNKVTVIQTAVASYDGLVTLYPGNGATTNYHVASIDLFRHANSLDNSEVVSCLTLNTILKEREHPRKFELLVIDVNGDEPFVLDGIDLDQWQAGDDYCRGAQRAY